jgi:hypothetical protein
LPSITASHLSDQLSAAASSSYQPSFPIFLSGSNRLCAREESANIAEAVTPSLPPPGIIGRQLQTQLSKLFACGKDKPG